MNDLVKRFGSTYPRGMVIFKEGDAGNEMYIIHSGAVNISKRAQKSEQVLATLTDGEFFGEMSVFTEQERSATATVIKESTILRLNKKAFDYMVENNVDFAINMIRKLCERLRRADQHIAELLVVSRETRILKALDQFWKKAGQKDTSGEILLLPFDDFLEYVKKYHGMGIDDSKKTLLTLKKQNLLHIRKDMTGNVYISFSPKIFEFINII